MPRASLTVLGALQWTSDFLDPIKNAPVEGEYNGEIAVYNIIQECGEMGLIFQNIDLCKELIARWVIMNSHRWKKMFETEYFNYNPIENYDRFETWHDSGTSKNIGSVAAYDSKEFEPQAQADGSGENWHEGRTHGNIGVTTAQQMITQERALWEFNFYDWLTNEFKKRFCVALY